MRYWGGVSCNNGNSDPDGSGEDKKPDVVTGIKIGETTYTFEDIKITAPYGDDARVTYNDDKTVTIEAKGDYGQFKIVFTEAVDIKDKTVALTAKSDDFESGDNTFKFCVRSGEKKGSELAPEKNPDWVQKDAGIGADYKTYKANTYVVEWSKDNSIEEADFTKINELLIVPQTGKGKIVIQSIIIE